jgi:hypothetical protein
VLDIGGGDDAAPDAIDDVPSWMLAALAGETDRDEDGLPPTEDP